MLKEKKQINPDELLPIQQENWKRFDFAYPEGQQPDKNELRWDGFGIDLALFPVILHLSSEIESDEEFNSYVRTVVEKYFLLSPVLSTLNTNEGLNNGNTVVILEHILRVVEGLSSDFSEINHFNFGEDRYSQMTTKLRLAAFFHDWGKSLGPNGMTHCEISAAMAESILRNCPLTKDNDELIENVVWLCAHHHDYQRVAGEFFKEGRESYGQDQNLTKEEVLAKIHDYYQDKWQKFGQKSDHQQITDLFKEDSALDWSDLTLERLILLHSLSESDVMSNPKYEKYARENDYFLKTVLEVVFQLALDNSNLEVVADSDETEV